MMATRTLCCTEQAVRRVSGQVQGSAVSNFSNRTREVGLGGISPSDRHVKQHAILIALLTRPRNLQPTLRCIYRKAEFYF